MRPVQVHDYPAFKDSFEKARAELEAAADSPNKSRPSGGQAVQSRKVPDPLPRASPLISLHCPWSGATTLHSSDCACKSASDVLV